MKWGGETRAEDVLSVVGVIGTQKGVRSGEWEIQ